MQMTNLSYTNVFNAIYPDNVEKAEELHVRSELLIKVIILLRESGETKSEIAERLGVSKSRVSELMSGKIDLVSTERLIKYLSKLGKRVNISLSDIEQ